MLGGVSARQVTSFRLVQPSKQLLPRSVTEFGMVMLPRLVQPKKQDSPSSVTEFGMVMFVRLVQPAKQP